MVQGRQPYVLQRLHRRRGRLTRDRLDYWRCWFCWHPHLKWERLRSGYRSKTSKARGDIACGGSRHSCDVDCFAEPGIERASARTQADPGPASLSTGSPCCQFTARRRKSYDSHALCLIINRRGKRWQRSLWRCHCFSRPSVSGRAISFQITVLKVLAGHPGGRASLVELRRAVAILISSGTD